MILLQDEEKGAYATIVTVGCGGYCECEEKSAYANIVTVGCGNIVGV